MEVQKYLIDTPLVKRNLITQKSIFLVAKKNGSQPLLSLLFYFLATLSLLENQGLKCKINKN
jgi:hypothetical protein